MGGATALRRQSPIGGAPDSRAFGREVRKTHEEEIQPGQRDPVGHLRGVRGGGCGAGGRHRKQPVLLVDFYDRPVPAPLRPDRLRAGHHLPGGRRVVRLGQQGLSQHPLGRPCRLVVLAELSALDGLPGRDVPDAAQRRHRRGAGDAARSADSARLRLAGHPHRLFPRLRQHRHSERLRRHQGGAGAAGRRDGHLLRRQKRLCQRHGRCNLPAQL